MQTIYKYILNPSPCRPQEIDMYYGTKILGVGIDRHNDLAIWAEVDTSFPIEKHKFVCVGTGWDLSNIFHYKKIIFHGTIVDNKTGLVWHVYEVDYEC